MIVTTIRIRTNAENRKELLQTFSSLSGPIRGVTGCRSCRIYREVGTEEALMVIEEWESRYHWDEHLRSEEFAIMIGSLSLVQPPESVEYQILDQLEASQSITAIKARNFQSQGDIHESLQPLRREVPNKAYGC
jgi:quinol monooxygenase YgiN